MRKVVNARRAPFRSPAQAQFWFEWKRNGMLLPLIIAVLLAVILLPFLATVPFIGRVSSDTAIITLTWIIALPFVLAFIIGQGFGKTNFWGQALSKDLGVPLFLAVRPLPPVAWVSVKLKTAALSAILTWVLVITSTVIWLLTCCDCRSFFTAMHGIPPTMLAGLIGLPLLLLGALAVLITWRLLVANLYLGALGNPLLFNAAFCFVFIALFGPLCSLGWFNQNPEHWNLLLTAFKKTTWILGALVVCKLVLAVVLWQKGRQLGIVSFEQGLKYAALWLWGTELLLIAVFLSPLSAGWKPVLAMLSLLTLPLARISFAPLAFAHARSR